ncbi:MAG: DivIVA domain-containing protein [Gemmatimonadales bacterium]
MTDEGFHLSAHDVRHQEFPRGLRGYDQVQVDDFKERIAQELDRLWRDRGQMNDRVQSMIEQLKVFRDRERAMNEALIAAQQLRADVQAQADKESALILERARHQAEQLLAEARSEAQRIVDHAQGEEQRLHYANETVRRQFLAYMTSYRRLLERELAELEALASTDSRPATQVDAEVAFRRPA